MRQSLSVVLNMLSGTLTTYKKIMIGGGFILQFLVAFPRFMADIERLHEYWLKGPSAHISEDDPKIEASVQALMARHETGSVAVYSIALIRLPLNVETDVEYEALEDEEVVDGVLVATILIYIELKATTDLYSGTKSRKSFKRVRTGEPTHLTLSQPLLHLHHVLVPALLQGPK